jgi:hypothetical protein
MHASLNHVRRAVVVTTALAALPRGGVAQSPLAADPFVRLGSHLAPHFELSTLMEVTLLKIDVLTLTVRVPAATGERLRALARSGLPREALADSVARLVLASPRLQARQLLLRDVSVDRFLGGILETTRHAVNAGYVPAAYLASLEARLPPLFDFLAERGVRKGDEVFFEVRGGVSRTMYRDVTGDVLLDRTVDDADASRASIPAFFAPGTRFREGLINSLLEQAGTR